MNNDFRLRVLFYRTSSGNEPVREWLKRFYQEIAKDTGR
jgi:hypothetical protein